MKTPLFSPFIVGLTGGIASGKTTIADYLASQGAYLIDTDLIARQVVEPNTLTTLKIAELLGQDYLLADGNLHRGKIKQRIFNDDAMRAQYESIILPAIRQATLNAIADIPSDICYAVLIVPLLFEKGLDEYTDYNISVDLPVEEQIRRGIARKPTDEPVIRRIIATQMPREVRNSRADVVVDNTRPLEVLYPQLEALHRQLCALASKRNESEQAV